MGHAQQLAAPVARIFRFWLVGANPCVRPRVSAGIALVLTEQLGYCYDLDAVAEVAELAYALRSGRSGHEPIGVQLPSSAPPPL